MIRRLGRTWRRFRRREGGNATVEFVIVFPAFMLLMASGAESGLLLIRQMMLERGLDLSVRAVRLGGAGGSVDADELREMICEGAAIIPDCMNQVKVEMIRMNPQGTLASPQVPDCVDHDEEVQVSRTYDSGAGHDLMFLRACALFDPIFPNFGLGVKLADEHLDYALVSSSVFVIEP
ncbi:TadE/TadG family type IV pilus assembly protein [Histidinibacterium aquaticum]|uniref:Pilus assembly protein n=1 Tax=Histidinibacterium aquaticum TaxID=2613962 RepID=A0A5J5GQC5_9RHOB|nr:TadE family protein [Histidinibacterium aquaticum]KAA9010257.1 pilus assembly protein [Histidinibacterium aquaticum]